MGFLQFSQKIIISFFYKWSQMLGKIVLYKFQLEPYLGKIWLLGNRPLNTQILPKVNFFVYYEDFV